MTTLEETRTGTLVRLPGPLTPALVRALSGQHDDGEATLAVIPCDDGMTRIARRSWPGRLSEREVRGVRAILAAHAAEALS